MDTFEDSQAAIKEFEKASDNNRENDLYYHRMTFIAYEIGTDPQLEGAFGNVNAGDAFISVLLPDEFARFKFNGTEISNQTLVQFTKEFRRKEIEAFYPSEAPYTVDQYLSNSNVLQVTGAQFREKIVQQQMNYLVLFCNHHEYCQLAINLVKFIEKFNPNSDILQFAFMNTDKNEVKGLKITNYPTLALFSVGSKNKPRGYDLEMKPGALMGWLNVNFVDSRRTCQAYTLTMSTIITSFPTTSRI